MCNRENIMARLAQKRNSELSKPSVLKLWNSVVKQLYLLSAHPLLSFCKLGSTFFGQCIFRLDVFQKRSWVSSRLLLNIRWIPETKWAGNGFFFFFLLSKVWAEAIVFSRLHKAIRSLSSVAQVVSVVVCNFCGSAARKGATLTFLPPGSKNEAVFGATLRISFSTLRTRNTNTVGSFE